MYLIELLITVFDHIHTYTYLIHTSLSPPPPREPVLQPDSSNQGDNSGPKHTSIFILSWWMDPRLITWRTQAHQHLRWSQQKCGYYLGVRITARTHLSLAITYYTMTTCEHFLCVLAISCWPAHCDISSSGTLTLQRSPNTPPPHHRLTLPTTAL